MADKEKNKQALKEALDTLSQIAASPSTPKTIKKNMTDLISELQNSEHLSAILSPLIKLISTPLQRYYLIRQ